MSESMAERAERWMRHWADQGGQPLTEEQARLLRDTFSIKPRREEVAA